MGPPPARDVSPGELARHNTPESAWIAVGGEVLDVSKFARLHPGGAHWLQQVAGKDATEEFLLYHSPDVRRKYFARLRVGTIGRPAAPSKPPGTFGDLVPWGDPSWYQGLRSPYYTDSHRKWRAHCRDVLEREVFDTLHEWRGAGRPPQQVLRALGSAGLLGAMVGSPYPRQHVPAAAAAAVPSDFDTFHELILLDELARCGDAGACAAISTGPAIALPVVLREAPADLAKHVAGAVLSGESSLALAISEPNAGSDVAGLATRAESSGTDYVVTGSKKFITCGMYADWFVTAVRTGGPGPGGVSLVLIDARAPGVSVRKLDVRSPLPGTAYVNFNAVRVPQSSRIGPEGKGFAMIMQGFNHERFWHVTLCSRFARVCLEESIRYAARRKTFGRPLHEHQAIRMKIAQMARDCEQLHNWIEHLAFQIREMSAKEAMAQLGGLTALIKSQASKVYERCAREATMIFGGNALVVGGAGSKIEPAVNSVKFQQIPAGAEDVMDDFAARDAFRRAARLAAL
eukprot:TRINITY_DN11956_c0_g1_i1.p1 TRINITY_DN11956_c0_g1~~TRINITY_DN11956_c0_g1_i1.p1  ORF type:complete len:564 (+),score=176.54 TRINITY_DN11956_c0_g1_i1:145-1692(+)